MVLFIYCFRSGGNRYNPGQGIYMRLIDELCPQYAAERRNAGKRLLIEGVIDRLHLMGIQFMQKDPNNAGEWILVTDEERIYEKVRTAFADRVRLLRRCGGGEVDAQDEDGETVVDHEEDGETVMEEEEDMEEDIMEQQTEEAREENAVFVENIEALADAVDDNDTVEEDAMQRSIGTWSVSNISEIDDDDSIYTDDEGINVDLF